MFMSRNKPRKSIQDFNTHTQIMTFYINRYVHGQEDTVTKISFPHIDLQVLLNSNGNSNKVFMVFDKMNSQNTLEAERQKQQLIVNVQELDVWYWRRIRQKDQRKSEFRKRPTQAHHLGI